MRAKIEESDKKQAVGRHSSLAWMRARQEMGKNNFDGVRIALALIVVFGHVAVLTKLPEFSVFGRIFDSNFAVKGFFAISGFLVTKSYLTSTTTLEYVEKRLRRIYPAYIAAVFLCLCIGFLVSTLDGAHFLSAAQTYKYIFSNAIFLNFLQPTLPGVFETNPTQALNGSLWTIKIEVMLYACVPFIVFFYRRAGPTVTTLSLIALSVGWNYFFGSIYTGSAGAELARQFPGQLAFFVFGSYLAVKRDALGKIKWIFFPSIAALLVIDDSRIRLVLDPLAYTSIVIFFSTLKGAKINFGKFGDISYGLYLYHFPIIQLLIYSGLFEYPWVGLLGTLVITTFVSLSSWHLVEKRLLKRSSHYILATKGGAAEPTRPQP